jgi:hypothetical protein
MLCFLYALYRLSHQDIPRADADAALFAELSHTVSAVVALPWRAAALAA